MLRILSLAAIGIAMLCLSSCTVSDFETVNSENSAPQPALQAQYQGMIVGKYQNGAFSPQLNDEDLKRCFHTIADRPMLSTEFTIIDGAFYLKGIDEDSRMFLGLDLQSTDGSLRLNGDQIDCIGDCDCEWTGTVCACTPPGTVGTCSQKGVSGGK